MVTVLRTNLVTNPSFEVDTADWTASASTLARHTGYSRPGKVGAALATLTVASPAGTVYAASAGGYPASPGQWVGFAVNIGRATGSAGGRVSIQFRTGSTQVSIVHGAWAALPSSSLERQVIVSQVPATADNARVFVYPGATSTGGTPLDGITLMDAASVSVAASEADAMDAVATFFDGATSDGPLLPDGSRLIYDWTGTANASASTESLTDAVISASLINSAGTPPPVQIVLNGIPNGAEYVVTGSTGAGSSWPVPGGTGVGDGGQIVLVDNRSALNTPVTYSVVVQGVTYSANPVTVAHDGSCVLQSLDSQTVIPVKLHDNLDPRSLEIRAVAFSVPGRRRPPVRYATGGYGGGELQVTTTGDATAALRTLILSGRPILIRTDGSTPLENAVELILPTRADYAVGTVVQSYGDSRRWSIAFLYVDDPEPSRVLSAWTWDDFDEAALVSFPTWDDFDALFAGSTWDDFDTTDWGQYQ